MKQKAYLYALFVAAFLSLIGILLFLSILGHLEQSIHTYRETELFSRPGAFLYGSFHWFSFYIPLYLFASAFLLLFRPFKSNWLLLLTLSIVPFLTFSLVIKLFTETGAVQAPLSSLVAESFGRVPGAILILVIALIETLLLVQLHGYLNRRSVSHGENMAGGKEKGQEPHGEVSLADASSSLAEITDYLSETDNDWEAKLEEAKRDAEDPPLASEAEEEGSPGGENGLGTGNDAGNGKDGGNGKDAGTILRVLEDRSLIPMDPPERSGKALETVRAGETIAVEDAEFERVETDLHPVSDKPSRKSYRYSVPVNGILQDYTDAEYWKIDAETQAAGRTLMKTLEEFNISAELTGIQKGPVITMFEILPSPGVKLSRIVNLADNIALRLAALRVRIVAPIPGKHAVGIEVPNKERANVPFKEMITLDKFQKSQYAIPVVLGKDISGVAQIVDLVQTPHLLIAGATGSGKSVCVNAIICSILYKRRPDEVRLMLIDPKIVELKIYNDIPHLLTPVITDPKRSFQALQYCIYEMERRYSLLDALEVRDIHSYNRKITRKALATEPLPYIVIVIDEFADLMATSGKE
ncbi:MAG TPA: DNA translocase FtsK, partial [Spirochaetia bacterium]|nr:DNA translocase FtsK [Spirochaetia bacterium]